MAPKEATGEDDIGSRSQGDPYDAGEGNLAILSLGVMQTTEVWAKEIFKQNVRNASWIILDAYDEDRERGKKRKVWGPLGGLVS